LLKRSAHDYSGVLYFAIAYSLCMVSSMHNLSVPTHKPIKL
jgi:hypothetical protein